MRSWILWLSWISPMLAGDLQLSPPFGSHMVLPMDREVPLHGTADPGKSVVVRFHGREFQTRTDANGAWQIMLPATPASATPLTLEVTSEGKRVLCDDLLIGEVWLCSGQSNMDFPLSRSTGGANEIKSANLPNLRLLNLTGARTDARAYDAATLARLNVKDHFQGSWQPCTPATAGAFSAVAYHTGKLLQSARGVPIGLIENAVGGSGTEAWLPVESLKARPDYQPLLSEKWLDSERVSAWARGRAKQNLGSHFEANHPFKPGFLFESGVRPFSGFPFIGVIWYQGETNAEIHDDAWNEQLIRDLVIGWRTALHRKSLPFFLVQLPRIGGSDPLRKFWPAYREVQARAVKSLPDTHLVVTQDLGWDSSDVHPPDKLPVAKRIAEAILKKPN
jgi:sialate O-acetylesterase